MNPEELLRAAKKAQRPTEPKKVNTDRWMPVVIELRGKGWTYADIYDWLKGQGQPVQRRKNTFIATVSRRYRHYLNCLTLHGKAVAQ